MPFHHKNIRLEHWNYLGQRWFFTTLCCANRRKHFASAKFSSEFLDILRANAATHEFAIHAYCLMPDHVHLLAEGLSPQSGLIQFSRAIKSKTSTPFERKSAKFDPLDGVRRKNSNIEHFLPQKPEDNKPIDSATRALIDNIGNLMVLSFRANSSLGNLGPEKRVQRLEGDLARKTENLHIVREFVKQYSKRASEWDEKAIQERARNMAQDAYERVWRLN
jgi:REP element-mobilizing transposase RayT